MAKIIELTAENIKRIRAVHITPNGKSVVLGGDNEAGKSSVLDAIMYALGGKNKIDEMPIRLGERQAKTRVVLDEIVVERTFGPSGSRIIVTSRDGSMQYNSPQKLLDAMIGAMAFDPLEFSRKKPNEQVEILKNITGLDFALLDQQREAAYTQRAEINRDLKRAEAQLNAAPCYDDAPDEEINTSLLIDQLKKANAQISKNQERRYAAQIFSEIITETIRKKNNLLKEITEREKELTEKKTTHAQLVEKIEQWKKDSESEQAEISALVDPPTNIIEDEIKNAGAKNDKRRANLVRKELAENVEKLRYAANNCTSEIEAVDLEKKKRLAAVKMPVSGLAFDSLGVTYDGIPFAQLSSAQALRVSMAIGMAVKSDLRTIWIRNGSLLDSSNMELILSMADENDYQVLIERVGSDKFTSVLIEDGQVVNSEKE